MYGWPHSWKQDCDHLTENLPKNMMRGFKYHKFAYELYYYEDLHGSQNKRKPRCEGLSGGEQQRICLARCFFMVLVDYSAHLSVSSSSDFSDTVRYCIR